MADQINRHTGEKIDGDVLDQKLFEGNEHNLDPFHGKLSTAALDNEIFGADYVDKGEAVATERKPAGIDLVAETAKFEARTSRPAEAESQTETLTR